jgi:hypothetical protein
MGLVGYSRMVQLDIIGGFMKIEWSLQNIVHVVLFAICVISLFINVLFIRKHDNYNTSFLCIGVAVIFFLLSNTKLYLRGGHIAVDMFNVIAIVSLFIYN